MNINNKIIKDILKNKHNSNIVIFKKFCTETPDWSEFIKYIDQSSRMLISSFPENLNDTPNTVVSGNMIIKQNFYFYLGIHGFLGKSSYKIQNEFSKIFKCEGGMTTVYVNLSTNINNISEHTDKYDNFYWQCIGITEWVYKNKKYLVEPGDLVYIPANVPHSVNFRMPRAAIGFSWDLSNFEINGIK